MVICPGCSRYEKVHRNPKKNKNRSFLECDTSAVSMEMEKKTNTDQQQ